MPEVLQWRPYTNPEDGRSGWISPAGKVVYGDNPQRKPTIAEYERSKSEELNKQLSPEKLSAKVSEMMANQEKIVASEFKKLVDNLSALSPADLAKVREMQLGQKQTGKPGEGQAPKEPVAAQEKPEPDVAAKSGGEGEQVTQEQNEVAAKTMKVRIPKWGEPGEYKDLNVPKDISSPEQWNEALKGLSRSERIALHKDLVPNQGMAESKGYKGLGKKNFASKPQAEKFLSPEHEALYKHLEAEYKKDYEERTKAASNSAAASGAEKPATGPKADSDASNTSVGERKLIKQADAEGRAEAPMRLAKDFPGRVSEVPGDPKSVHIRTVYGEQLSQFLKSMGAKWDPAAKKWRVAKDQAYQVYNFLHNQPGKEPAKFSRLGKGRPWTFTVELDDSEEIHELTKSLAEAREENRLYENREKAKRFTLVADSESAVVHDYHGLQPMQYERHREQRSELSEMIDLLKAQAEKPIIVNVHQPEIKMAPVTVNVPKADPVVVNIPKPDPVVVNIPPPPEQPVFDLKPVRDSEGKVTMYRRVPR